MGEVLVVASKVKAFIKSNHEVNVAKDVMEELSEMVETACNKAVAAAKDAGRKTVMAKDFE